MTRHLHGRDGLIEKVAQSMAPLTVLSGDSGIGKSEVLRAAQPLTAALAPPPRAIPRSGAALQFTVLSALGDAVVQHIDVQGRAREVLSQIVEIADRLSLEGAREVSKVIGRELLAVVRGRIGDDVGKAAVGYIRDLGAPISGPLVARLTAAADPGVANLLLDFADEVCRGLGDGQVVLALDDADRLNDEDRRLLADLAEELPSSLRLRVAFSTRRSDYQEQVDSLLASSPSAEEIRIAGLDHSSIEAWLVSESLDPCLAPEVLRVTGGYPLHIGDLVSHLQQGGSVEDAPRNELFVRHSREAWNSLPLDIARHARALCVFASPLPYSRILSFLDLSPSAWGEVQDRLWRSRVFSVEVNGQRWFHEQRRQFLADEVLGAEELGELSTHALHAMHDFIKDEGAIERSGELAVLASNAMPALRADPHLSGAVSLSREELILAASLIELIEPGGTDGVSARNLLEYSTEVFGLQGDLLPALRQLGSRDLVAVAHDDSGAAALAPYWGSELAFEVVMGRAANDLKRMPVPRVATTVFEFEIRPRLVPFKSAHYGIGRPSMGRLSRYAIDLQQPSAQYIGSFSPGSNLLLRGKYAGRGLYAAIAFNSEDERNNASWRLNGLRAEVLGESLEVDLLLRHPVEQLPSCRFVRAVERLIGKGLGTPVSVSSPISFESGRVVSPEEAVRRKAEVVRLLRDRSSDLERMASRLDEPIGYAFLDHDEMLWEIEVRGGREGFERVEQAGLSWNDPYLALQLGRLLRLERGEYIAHVNSRGGGVEKDPIIDAVVGLHLNTAQFNRAQGFQYHRRVVMNREWLEHALTNAAQLNFADAQALAVIGPIDHSVRVPQPRTTHVLIRLGPLIQGFAPGTNAVAHYFHVPNPSGSDRVTVTIRRSEDVRAHVGEDLKNWFGRLGVPGQFKDYNQGSAVLSYFIARLLGHLGNEIRLVFPEGE